MCTINPRTTDADLERTLRRLDALARRADSRGSLRAGASATRGLEVDVLVDLVHRDLQMRVAQDE